MSCQIPDEVRFDRKLYRICGGEGDGLFNPANFNLHPVRLSSACDRGYEVIYSVRRGKFALQELEINLVDQAPPINGVKPERKKRNSAHRVYHKLNLLIEFTGKLQIGRNIIPEMRTNYGSPSAYAYEQVMELKIERGIVVEVADISKKMEEVRNGIIERRTLGRF
ncbi:MAG: hypothetical protein A2X86_19625 [Bdellovibrionales bacterium GWA2_49_15]|nr:MAG: hypothetical protein A2X86_19625 [Bdellovibrionales bacterium GWA2_49_15]HAZ13798.1 hypothetical protein [Bdellovibrionales bacterium]